MINILHNYILISAVISWAVAQGLKVIINTIQNRKLELNVVFSTGGMPSSHTATVVALATSVGIAEGFDSTFFAIACVFCMVVMYDAIGLRQQAGKHAQLINILTMNLPDKPKLKELLGHKPIEVFCGMILGILVAYIV